MASDTKIDLRKQMIYSIFVRNYSKEGNFEEVRRDLDRIKDLGTDIIWLLPIQPSGKEKRKGSLGSPYAISDYRAINPEYGTMEDFKRLCDDVHAKGMKIIIDCVYNHTSPDSVLAKEHPEWFYHKKDGSFGNRVGDWSDVIDLDYSHKNLKVPGGDFGHVGQVCGRLPLRRSPDGAGGLLEVCQRRSGQGAARGYLAS